MYHFVYKTTNTSNNKIYIGVHSTNNLNDNYLGSGTNLKKALIKYGKHSFYRKILFHFNTREEALEKEKEIVKLEFCLREDVYNMMLGGGHPKENILTRDVNEILFSVPKTDERYLNGELVHIMTGRVSVKDEDGNKFIVSKTDERLLSGEVTTYYTKSEKQTTKTKINKSFSTEEKNKKFYNKILLKTGRDISHITFKELLKEKEKTSLTFMANKYGMSTSTLKTWILRLR